MDSQLLSHGTRKLFAAPYQPRPFSFSVRPETDRCAEGVVSIEDAGAPVWTMCARRSQQTMKFPGSGTRVPLNWVIDGD